MTAKEYQVVKIPKETIARLRSRQHPSQAIAGVIAELLDAVELSEKWSKELHKGFSAEDVKSIEQAISKEGKEKVQ